MLQLTAYSLLSLTLPANMWSVSMLHCDLWLFVSPVHVIL